MSEVLLAVDTILAVIIGPTAGRVDQLIGRAREGEITPLLEDFALYCALYSVREGDNINMKRLSALVQYSQLQLNSPTFLGPEDRDSWTPSDEAVENWRHWALSD